MRGDGAGNSRAQDMLWRVNGMQFTMICRMGDPIIGTRARPKILGRHPAASEM